MTQLQKSSSKVFGTVLAAAILSAPVGLAVYSGTTDVPAPEPAPVVVPDVVVPNVIVGPEEAKIGELVRLNIEGDQVQWVCLPETEDMQTFGEHNEQCVLSFRRAGNYTILACVVKGGKLTLETLEIRVGVAPVVVHPDDPDDVGPVINALLVTKIKAWVAESPARSDQLDAIAGTFEQVVQEIQAGGITTPNEVVQRTVALNRKQDLKGLEVVMAKVQSEITALAPNTMEDHIVIWASIAAALREAAATK